MKSSFLVLDIQTLSQPLLTELQSNPFQSIAATPFGFLYGAPYLVIAFCWTYDRCNCFLTISSLDFSNLFLLLSKACLEIPDQGHTTDSVRGQTRPLTYYWKTTTARIRRRTDVPVAKRATLCSTSPSTLSNIACSLVVVDNVRLRMLLMLIGQSM